MSNRGWIGVDLDGTIAHYEDFVAPDIIGEPIPAMVARVRQWVAEGRDVRIFTARVWPLGTAYENWSGNDAATETALVACRAIVQWCNRHIGVTLPVVCSKDYHMYELWDDRAVQVIKNTGRRADGKE